MADPVRGSSPESAARPRFARYRRNPVLITGIVPALIAAMIVLGALGVLIYFATSVSSAITPFADHW